MNNTYLLKKWFPVILMIILLGAVLLLTLVNGNYSILVGTALGIFLLIYIRSRGANRIETALKQSTSKDLIRCLTEPLRHSKDRQLKAAFTAYHKALSHILYGEYDEANNQIEKGKLGYEDSLVSGSASEYQGVASVFSCKRLYGGAVPVQKSKSFGFHPGDLSWQ
jgi:hypothetical protein